MVLSGGVAANKELRRRFSEELEKGCSTIYPDFSHCTDNGTMIAFAGYEKLNHFKEDNKISVNPRWSLEEIANGLSIYQRFRSRNNNWNFWLGTRSQTES